MSDSKTTAKAQDYLTHMTKGKVTGADSLVKDGKLNITSHRSRTVNHLAVANEMIKVITTTPGLPTMCRKIMCLRILNPGITDMGVALSVGLRVDVVRKYEAEGKHRVSEYMKSTDIADNIEKFNTDRIIQNELKNMNKQGDKNPLKFDVKA
jgi:hypothetical protein